MEIALKVSSAPHRPIPLSRWSSIPLFGLKRCEGNCKKLDFFRYGSNHLSVSNQVKSGSVGDLHRCRSNLESLFCYDKSIPEEIIEKPVGLSMGERNIGDSPRCEECHAKGAILCVTCSGSGLYIDSILESQGILVKVRCLVPFPLAADITRKDTTKDGCGGTGNMMCSVCRGRGHLGVKQLCISFLEL